MIALLVVLAQAAPAPPAAEPHPQPVAAPAPIPAPALVPPPAPPPPPPEEPLYASENDATGYTPADGALPPLLVSGYVDVGFARAQGDGTSFASGNMTIPYDYGADTFATAVNSRGDVASIGPCADASAGFCNGFLPRSAGTGGQPSFLLSTASVDFRTTSPTAPLMVFVRVQLMPRFGEAGDGTRVLAQQAFGRLLPLDAHEFALSVGRFDSVFGIEYLDNEANLRTGVTPSLIARYTTGQSLGAKAFYRVQIPAFWSALSLNLAATNHGTLVDSLQGPDASLTGVPVASGRIGYEMNLPRAQLKLGGSFLHGPRNDQRDRDALETGFGVDGRIVYGGVSVAGEYIVLDQDAGGSEGKDNGSGRYPVASEFHVRGFWVQAAYGLDPGLGALRRVTPYARFERRHAWFEGFTPVRVQRITAGLRLDLWDSVALKGEILHNTEQGGTPAVDNDVLTSSLVYSW